MGIRRRESSGTVRKAQAALVALGYELGTIDGIYGRRTENAITRWAAACEVARRPGELHTEALALLLSAGEFAAENDDEEHTDPTPADLTIRGFDTSGHQKSSLLDIGAAVAAGEQFHIVKVTEDKLTAGRVYVFKAARERMELSRAAGLLTGEYIFFRPEDGWKDDVQWWRKYSCYQAGDLPPMLDFEKGRRVTRKDGKPDVATRAMADHNLGGAVEAGKAIADVVGLKPIMYITLPSWQWYARNASPEVKAKAGEVFDLLWTEYPRKGTTDVGDPDLAASYTLRKLERARKEGLAGDVVAWQWTGKGRVPWYADGKKPIDRCVMLPSYFERHAVPY